MALPINLCHLFLPALLKIQTTDKQAPSTVYAYWTNKKLVYFILYTSVKQQNVTQVKGYICCAIQLQYTALYRGPLFELVHRLIEAKYVLVRVGV